jgi:hypothetical protein
MSFGSSRLSSTTDDAAVLLLTLHKLKPGARDKKVAELLQQIGQIQETI